MLRSDGMNFIVAQLYYFGVRLLGGRGVEQKNIDKDPLFECKDFDLIVDQLRKMKSSDITAASS